MKIRTRTLAEVSSLLGFSAASGFSRWYRAAIQRHRVRAARSYRTSSAISISRAAWSAASPHQRVYRVLGLVRFTLNDTTAIASWTPPFFRTRIAYKK
jgi:hypothetical protein